ncbi:MAG TPA: hypothetical protein VHD90_03365 [Phototrophicaceae bacterium]|nr:hypothetical protein [Phototrophicaceae bacterium]
MSASSRLILIFALVFALLIVNPALLSQPFPLYPLMKWGDVTDVLTPLILIPLYWLLFRQGNTPTLAENIAFLVFAAFWVEGQGMHLGANSIGHLLDEAKGTDAQLLTHFYDEVLGHYLWHIGLVTLAGLLIWRQIKNPLAAPLTSLRTEVVAALLYGFVFFIIADEAGTVPLCLPFAVIVVIVGLTQRRKLREQPITAFFLMAHALALILLAIWFVRWGSFPQFSDLGWI